MPKRATKPESSTKPIKTNKPVYEPPKLTKFEKLEKLIVSGE